MPKESISIHQQPHFYNKIGAMLFGSAVFTESVFLLNFKEKNSL